VSAWEPRSLASALGRWSDDAVVLAIGVAVFVLACLAQAIRLGVTRRDWRPVALIVGLPAAAYALLFFVSLLPGGD
jgi:hypothetical protein